MHRPSVSQRRQIMAAIVISTVIMFGLDGISEAAAQPAQPQPPVPVDIVDHLCSQPAELAELICELLQPVPNLLAPARHDHAEVSYEGITTYEPAGAMGGNGILR